MGAFSLPKNGFAIRGGKSILSYFMFQDESAILTRIKESPVITIWGHGLPDEDCYGCQIGLREILRANFPDKKVYAVGTGVPRLFKRLAPTDVVSDEEVRESFAILVDVSCLRRVEDPRVFTAKSFAKFDHHMPNPEEYFDDLMIVEPKRVSCGELIAEFAFRNHLKVPKLAAEALYSGICTDSGRFEFYGTNADTFRVVAKLFDCGVVPDTLLSIVFQEEAKVVHFRSYILEHSKVEGKVAYCRLTKEDYLPFGLTFEEASGLATVLGALKTEFYVLFTADLEGEVRVEMRSHAPYAVQPTAMEFGGGGHLYAAGCSIHKGDENGYDSIIRALNAIEPSED